jgi:hypothetical protein
MRTELVFICQTHTIAPAETLQIAVHWPGVTVSADQGWKCCKISEGECDLRIICPNEHWLSEYVRMVKATAVREDS